MPIVTVFGSSTSGPDDPEYRDGRRLGGLLASEGWTVVTGGYGGLMEAVSAGAREAGGRVIGVTAPEVFPDREGPNPHVDEERRAASLVERIHELTDIADASVALPGSIGTLTELLVAWNLAFVAPFSRRRPKPVVAVGSVWGELVPLVAERLATPAIVSCVESVEEVAGELRRLMEEAGTPG